MKVLLSIKPEFAFKIFDGSKGYEFRKSLFRRNGVRTVVVYVTRPVGKLIGEFDIETIIDADPESVWKKTESKSGITEEFFFSYFMNRKQAFAIKVGEVRHYDYLMDPDDLIENFSPPQSYMYLTDNLQRISGAGKQLALL